MRLEGRRGTLGESESALILHVDPPREPTRVNLHVDTSQSRSVPMCLA